MDKLPRVFANPIEKDVHNVQSIYHAKDERTSSNPKNINRKINEIFSSLNHVYKSKVKITFDNRVEEHTIVGKTNVNLLTMDGKLIKITDIVDIERIQ